MASIQRTYFTVNVLSNARRIEIKGKIVYLPIYLPRHVVLLLRRGRRRNSNLKTDSKPAGEKEILAV